MHVTLCVAYPRQADLLAGIVGPSTGTFHTNCFSGNPAGMSFFWKHYWPFLAVFLYWTRALKGHTAEDPQLAFPLYWFSCPVFLCAGPLNQQTSIKPFVILLRWKLASYFFRISQQRFSKNRWRLCRSTLDPDMINVTWTLTLWDLKSIDATHCVMKCWAKVSIYFSLSLGLLRMLKKRLFCNPEKACKCRKNSNRSKYKDKVSH